MRARQLGICPAHTTQRLLPQEGLSIWIHSSSEYRRGNHGKRLLPEQQVGPLWCDSLSPNRRNMQYVALRRGGERRGVRDAPRRHGVSDAMIASMIDLFADGDLVATRTHTQYEISAGGRLVARTRNRPVAASHWGSYILRLLASSHATRRIEMDVVDASDVPRWQITLEPGDHNTFAAEVTLPDGTPVGRARADGGLLNPFPSIELTDPTGVRLGHATSRGRRRCSTPMTFSWPSSPGRAPSAPSTSRGGGWPSSTPTSPLSCARWSWPRSSRGNCPGDPGDGAVHDRRKQLIDLACGWLAEDPPIRRRSGGAPSACLGLDDEGATVQPVQ